MRSIVRPVQLAVAAALVSLAIGTGAATAGGPTSVLIVNPSTGATASLYTTDADYTTLLNALEPSGVAAEPMPFLSAGPGTSAINITWLIHDVSVWRVDHVRLDNRRLWVQTNTSSEITGSNNWNLATGEDAALGVLDRLGVLNWKDGDAGSAKAADKTEAVGGTKDDTTMATDDAAASTRDSADVFAGSWWLLPGVIVGAALAVVGRPYVMALAARREPGPRRQLIDI